MTGHYGIKISLVKQLFRGRGTLRFPAEHVTVVAEIGLRAKKPGIILAPCAFY